MHKVFILLFLFNSGLGWSQSNQPKQILYQNALYWLYESQDSAYLNSNFKWWYIYDDKGKYLEKQHEFPKDGKWIYFYKQDSSKIAGIFEIRDSLLHGVSTIFDFSGYKESEYEFYKGEQNGHVRYWNKNGQLTLDHQYIYKDYGHFHAGAPHGEWKNWYGNGRLSKIKNYKDGKQQGPQLEFYENGTIKTEAFYVQDEKDSTLSEFHDNGNLKSRITYKNGVFIPLNPHKEFHPNNSLSGTGDLDDNRRTGRWTFYFDNGTKAAEGTYGTYIYQHEHGDIYYSIKKDIWTYWYPNGKIKASGMYLEEGAEFQFDDTTARAALAPGWKYYDTSGKIITKEQFEKMGIQLDEVK